MSQLEIDFETQQSDNQVNPGEISLSDLFDAYFSCRKHKRNTCNALKFEMNCEEELFKLWREINNGSYPIGRSIAFIVEKPVKREIFAANFRDRIVHHLIINKLNHLFEKEFIYDNYSCRKGRGTLFGIKRVERFVRACSENHTRECYVLKMDVQGFFMSIRRDLLFDRLLRLIEEKYHGTDKKLLVHLVRQVVMNDCLTLHPKKITLQSYCKGVKFIGAF